MGFDCAGTRLFALLAMLTQQDLAIGERDASGYKGVLMAHSERILGFFAAVNV